MDDTHSDISAVPCAWSTPLPPHLVVGILTLSVSITALAAAVHAIIDVATPLR
jgi:hypothetical protein